MARGDYFIFNKIKFKTGDKVTCMINRKIIDDAKIYVNGKDETTINDSGYICQNILHGATSPDFLGYNSSWAFHIIRSPLESRLTDGVTKLQNKDYLALNEIVSKAFPIKDKDLEFGGIQINGQRFKTGDKIQCCIDGTKIDNAKIFIILKKDFEEKKIIYDLPPVLLDYD